MGSRSSWMIGTALAAVMCAPAGCTLPRRQVMLVLTTDIECAVFDRFEIRLSRGGSGDVTWTRTFLRNDCPAVGASLPRAPLARGSDPSVAYRLGIVDARRSDARLRVEVTARRPDAQVMQLAAETDFVDGLVYAMPMELATVCLNPIVCPANFVCRRDPSTAAAGCGSIYRAPGTIGTFSASSSIVADETVVLEDDPP